MPGYLMEHPLEAERLELKTRRGKILEELEHVPIESGMEVLDVGCGTGAVTRILAEKAAPGRVVGLDLSEERLAIAKDIARKERIENVRYTRGSAGDLSPKDRRFDLVYSRCLFQYLPGQAGMDTLAAMKQRARSGGSVCVADVDGNALYRYPLDEEWDKAQQAFLKELQKAGFDPYVGRKLYTMFHRTGFRDIQVTLLPYYLIAGKADPTTLRVWEMKVQILEDTLKKILTSDEKVNEMVDRFMNDLKNEEMLLYNFLFLVQGKA